MRLPQPLLRTRFVSRPNRFAAWVDAGDRLLYCHMPNPGRMRELLTPGAPLYVTPRPAPGRRTTHEVVLARGPEGLICLDSRLPPGLLVEAWHGGLVPELGDCLEVRREVRQGASRLDLLLECSTGRWLVETKSCTLVEDGLGLFPDAPTLRGTRHLRELTAAVGGDYRPAVAFLIQRSDARALAPHDATDPAFGEALRRAAAAGVELMALRCRVTTRAVVPLQRVPVELDV